MKRAILPLLAIVAMALGCQAPADEETAEVMEPVMLGPVDGHDLAPVDTGRVAAGDMAPDFALASLAGPNVQLSSYRGEKNVILVFYRGHW